MGEFNSVEMTEEEVDQIAGGQNAATFEKSEDGHTSIQTLKIEDDGSKAKANGLLELREPYIDPELKRKMDQYPGVIFY
ncbi:MAG: hypothetical protein IKN12_00030 [Selenomonadaceae bacterium]|nr:hypothetical protein [Selenomonadaceae bacterium]